LCFDADGNLFATSPNFNEVEKLYYFQGLGYFDAFASTNYTQSHLSSPINLVFDGAGNFYVANNTNDNPFYFYFQPSPYNNAIEKFSANFTDLGTFAANLNCPSGMAFDSAGNLYVADSGTIGSLNNTIVKFNTNGVRSTFATASSGLTCPEGLAFDSAGNLFVANSGHGNIIKFTPNGSASIFASGLNSPTSIAIFPGQNVWSATAIKLNKSTDPAKRWFPVRLQ
jgi:sugar lactone lactonase YvrE